MFRTFKCRLTPFSDVPANSMALRLPEGTFFATPPLSSVEYNTIFLTDQIFELSKDEILFSQQINQYNDNLYLDPSLQTPFRDQTKYILHKHIQRKIMHYEIKVDNLRIRVDANWWNKFLLNIIHDRYWLFNEKKWFVTFAISIAGFILALIALLMKK